MIYLIIGLILLLSYLFGGFSTARILAKNVRSLNIYKVGTGLADTENIYTNVSHPMGILVGLIDASKSYFYLAIVNFILQILDQAPGIDLALAFQGNVLMLYGMALLIGHCLPISNHLRGGRGIFTYVGIVAFFAPIPSMIAVLIGWGLVFFWKQIRFAQYSIVILPLILESVLESFIKGYNADRPPHFIPMMMGLALLMGITNITLSKRLGEF
ncbi:MAG TPA: glycerol-3-phosphate acyltransferase [Candidatus Cloacimonadota bacterium]|nr:glycerol-3-phosphate acyltransferase [Candidatus Cloacimonadota bacterium]HPS39066.1 glycerol-3-phosphate acyltransferase [Candidatus Cloacimonadota bacterium]